MNENAKWITDKTFCGLTPKNDVFHKAIKKYTPAHDDALLNSHILFRKKFTVTEFKKCNIHISADDYYFLYINGQFVCSGPSPAYPWHYYYNDIDISEYVTVGENTSVLQKIKDEGAWLNMLKEGATTTYEAWGKEQKKNTSLCHPWSTCPILILYDI